MDLAPFHGLLFGVFPGIYSHTISDFQIFWPEHHWREMHMWCIKIGIVWISLISKFVDLSITEEKCTCGVSKLVSYEYHWYHTTRRPQRPRCVLNYFRERSEDVVEIGIFCITRFSLRSLYVPCRFVLRPPRSHQVIITCTATRELRPPCLNCALNTFLLRLERPFYVYTTHLSRSYCVWTLHE
jgi:hypothetical protein